MGDYEFITVPWSSEFIFFSILGVVSKKVKPILGIFQVGKTQGLLAKGFIEPSSYLCRFYCRKRHLSTEALLKVLGCGENIAFRKTNIFPASSDSTLDSVFSIYPDDQAPCFFQKQILLIFIPYMHFTSKSFLLESCLF